MEIKGEDQSLYTERTEHLEATKENYQQLDAYLIIWQKIMKTQLDQRRQMKISPTRQMMKKLNCPIYQI